MCAKQRLSLHSQRKGIGSCILSSRAFSATLSFALRKTSSTCIARTPMLAACRRAFPSRAHRTLPSEPSGRTIALVGAREEHLARNEALFREVNERVAEVATHFIEVETKSDPVDF